MAYCAQADIERLIGDIVESRTFTAVTVPTVTQVTAEITNIAAEIDAALDAAGYTAPVSLADYPNAYNYLKAANAYGAAAVLLATIPAQAYEPDDEIDAGSIDRGKMYSQKFKAALKKIEDHKIRAGMARRRLANIYSGGQADAQGNVKEPLFTRGMDDYPGVILNGSAQDSDEDS